ncbi:hypothetical protein AMECASPLE_021989 [Ameca splendens]|uniref:Secreted protein n=1 Tax=Ameca splendens TaxID=208324 RepID=A0ABV0YFN0_9TELE
MRSEALVLYFTLLQIAGAGFPEDSEPISISHGNYTKQYPAFVGHKPGRNNTQRHKLDIQLIVIMNRTLYIAASFDENSERKTHLHRLHLPMTRLSICWHSNQHPVRLILHPITFRRLAFKGPSAVFILACQLSSSLLHPTSTIFLPFSSRLPRSLAANPPPVSDQGEDISKSKP